MTLSFPLLFWLGAPLLLAAALAVHLLNLQRQRPVRWAAMDFLLESERINRVWLNLKQWLLLALRLAALALAAWAL
ncbi:MAG: BatA domain-containing protein, partial [Myxococcales bacterium]|nr:BatA domain-containing protein [Myxococcales bacterium]